MQTATRKLISKEIAQDADQYVGTYGEVWFQEGTTTLRFGDDVTPGGVANGVYSCAPGGTSVVYTSSSEMVRTLRATAQAIGYETGVTDFPDTHSADIMVVKNIRTGMADASVYGVTYTSVAPLVTFDAQIDADGKLQITATPTSLTNSVAVKITVTEISE